MQDFTNSSSTEFSIAIGMDIHKKTIALCVYNASTAEILDERELLHDLPRVLKYFKRFRIVMARCTPAMKHLRVDLCPTRNRPPTYMTHTTEDVNLLCCN